MKFSLVRNQYGTNDRDREDFQQVFKNGSAKGRIISNIKNQIEKKNHRDLKNSRRKKSWTENKERDIRKNYSDSIHLTEILFSFLVCFKVFHFQRSGNERDYFKWKSRIHKCNGGEMACQWDLFSSYLWKISWSFLKTISNNSFKEEFIFLTSPKLSPKSYYLFSWLQIGDCNPIFIIEKQIHSANTKFL